MRRYAPTREEVERMWKMLEADHTREGLLKQAVFRLASQTGLRTSEMLRLRTADLDLKKKTIIVHGMSRLPCLLPVCTDFAKGMRDYIKKAHLGLDDRLIPISRFELWRIVSDIGRKAKVPLISPQRLRRFMISDVYRRTKDLRVTRAFVRHVPIKEREPSLAELRRWAEAAGPKYRHSNTSTTRQYEYIKRRRRRK